MKNKAEEQTSLSESEVQPAKGVVTAVQRKTAPSHYVDVVFPYSVLWLHASFRGKVTWMLQKRLEECAI